MKAEIVLSTVVASATVIYVVVTIFQLIESRKTRLQKEAPVIIPFLKSSEDHTVLKFMIKNFGEGVAKDVNVSFLEEFNLYNKDILLSNIGISKYGMNIFPPEFEMSYYVGWWEDVYKKHKEDQFKIRVTYKSLDNRQFTSVFELPIKQMTDQNYSTPPETHIGKISYYLEKISKEIEKQNKV